MALITCTECQRQISDRAAVCVHCGAPLQAQSTNAVPVLIRKEPSSKWWLWIPLGLVGAFFLFAALLPESSKRASEFRRVCREIAGVNPAAIAECDREEARIRSTPAQADNRHVPPVNTSFVPEPPRPVTQSNEEILSCVVSGNCKPAGPQPGSKRVKAKADPAPAANPFEGQSQEIQDIASGHDRAKAERGAAAQK